MNYNKLLLFLMITFTVMAGCKNPTGHDLDDTEKPDTEKPSLTLSYNANGADSGSVPDSSSVIEGESVTIAGNEGSLVKAGYPFFVGWNTAADGSGDFLRPGETMKMPGNDQTLYAYWVGVNELTASGGKDDDKFGFSVDIDGDYAVVGAAGYCTVYVFHRMGTNRWDAGTMLGKGGGDNGFGYSVSISGDFLLIGERNAAVRIEGETYPHSNQGKAHIYKRTGTNSWDLVKDLIASDGAAGDNFGYVVSLDGDYAAIGTYSKDKVYVYKKGSGGWSSYSESIIKASASSGEKFGWAVSLDGDTLAVGAYSDDYHGTGKVSVYERTEGNTWGTPAVISAPEQTATGNQHFGISVALDGDYLVVGDSSYDGTNSDQGAAFVYKRSSGNSWGSPVKLQASDGAAGDNFGSVAISGDTILVGAVVGKDASDESSQAAVYMFSRSGANSWDQVKKLTGSTGAFYHYNFVPVALDHTSLIIGSTRDDSYKGSASIYLYQ